MSLDSIVYEFVEGAFYETPFLVEAFQTFLCLLASGQKFACLCSPQFSYCTSALDFLEKGYACFCEVKVSGGGEADSVVHSMYLICREQLKKQCRLSLRPEPTAACGSPATLPTGSDGPAGPPVCELPPPASLPGCSHADAVPASPRPCPPVTSPALPDQGAARCRPRVAVHGAVRAQPHCQSEPGSPASPCGGPGSEAIAGRRQPSVSCGLPAAGVSPPAAPDVVLPCVQVGKGGRPDRPAPCASTSASSPQSKRHRASSESCDDNDDDDTVPSGPTITVLDSSERFIRRFKLTCRQETCVIDGLSTEYVSREHQVIELFDTIIDRQKQAVEADDTDFCFFEIKSDSNMGHPIYLSKRQCDQLNGKVILNELSRVLNSNESFLSTGKMHVNFLHITNPQPGGRSASRPNEPVAATIKHFLSLKGSGTLYDPKNKDDYGCLARCIVVAIRYQKTYSLDNKNSQYDGHSLAEYKKPDNEQQRLDAIELCFKAGIDMLQPCGLEEIHFMQKALPDYRLIVFDDNDISSTVFLGPESTPEKRRKNIYLLWSEGHFYSILKIKPFFGGSYECDRCLKVTHNKNDHRCRRDCWRCGSHDQHEDTGEVQLIRCSDCHRFMVGKECFDSHKVSVHGKPSQCDLLKWCSKCKKTYVTVDQKKKKKRKQRQHDCNLIICKYCKERVLENHLCYMREWEPVEKSEKIRYLRVFFDLECSQHTLFRDRPGVFEHRPNLLVCQTLCDDCDTEEKEHCGTCGKRENVFQNFDADDEDTDVVQMFLDYLSVKCSEGKTEILAMSHNFKGYDGNFILQGYLKRGKTPEVILQGAKIISLKIRNIHFKDSLCFIPQPLASFPKSFGLTEMKKGFFPHLANRPEYYNYNGEIPSKELYCTSSMSDKGLNEFSKWYDEQKRQRYVFNFQEEIISYCKSDVDILRKAVEVFRKEFMEISGFDPIFHTLTLSSAVMGTYRKNHLQPGTIGIVPRGGYRGRDKASYIALKWLSYMQHLLGTQAKIITAENGREMKVENKKVDGYCEIALPNGQMEKRIYEFYGCFFHACPLCVKDEKFRARLRGGNEDPYQKTVNNALEFRNSGYTVIEIWECEFKRDLKHNKDMIAFFEQNPFTRTEPMNLRDALCGGRTSALKLFMEADLTKGEQIRFYDVCSEYPWANMFQFYPIGHPAIFLENDPLMPAVPTWIGVAKLTVLPPDDLYLPVLPYKCCNKLMFPLCRTCAESMSVDVCNHSDSERMLTSTWCTPEIHLALEKNYSIVKVHELYQYPGKKQYDPKTGEEGLFSTFVKTHMALKFEASGWPGHVSTEEDKDKFIQDTLEKDGIQIRKDKVAKNPGRRTLAKLVLNSFWGKLGERTLRPSTQFVSKYSQLLALMTNPMIEVKSILPLGEDRLQVTHVPVADMDDSSSTTSVVHAAFTTCWGRLHLYKFLDIVGDRAAYHDTDSICYLHKPGFPDPPLGPYLGNLTSQLDDDYGKGSFCSQFVAGGPKNYSYVVHVNGDPSNVKVITKVRGISINSSCSDLVTFDNLKKMVMNEIQSITVNIPARIERVPGWSVVTRSSSKLWRVCLTKRRRIDDTETVPFGFNGAVLNKEDYDLINLMCV